jgi:hypothetical protein
LIKKEVMRELTLEEKEVIKEVRCATGLEEGQIIRVFETFSNIYALGQFSLKRKVSIPFLGDIYLQYVKDTFEDIKKEAIIRGFFTPSETLKQNIGYYEDYKKSGDKDTLRKLPTFQYLKNRAETALKKDK